VNPLPPFGQIGHQGPEIDQPFVECFVRTRAGFDPLQPHAGTFGGFSDRLNGETREPAVRTNLNWGIRLKADAKRTMRNRWQPSSEIPECQSPYYPSNKQDCPHSPPSRKWKHAHPSSLQKTR
jgi:hypothetical protein